MNIVTIMNYNWSEKKYIDMCYSWIYQAKLWLSKFDTIFICSEHTIPKKISNYFLSVGAPIKFMIMPRFKTNECLHFGVGNIDPVSNHNFLFKLYNTTNINFPYLFIDADAFIIDYIDELRHIFESSKDSVFFIDHETNIPRETDFLPRFINSGVFIMNDPNHTVYNWKKIYEYAKRINFTPKFSNGIVIPGTDQAIIKSYLDYIKYDYVHQDFGTEYNVSSVMANEWEQDLNSNRKYTTLKNNPNKKCKIIHYWGKNKNIPDNLLKSIS